MNVLITGAAGGLGRAFVNECIKRDYNIMAIDINIDSLVNLKNGVKSRFNKDILIYQTDITDERSIANLIAYLDEIEYQVEMLLNVAGLDFEGSFQSLRFNEVKRIIDLNITGTLNMTHEILNRRSPLEKLYIVNVSSLAASQPIPLKATYAASKRFLLDFSLALSEELKDQNTKVLTLLPGGLATKHEVIKAIEGQGFFGAITTCRIEKVVRNTINKVLKGRKKYIPGNINKLTASLSYLMPKNIITRLLYKRWKKAQSTWLIN